MISLGPFLLIPVPVVIFLLLAVVTTIYLVCRAHGRNRRMLASLRAARATSSDTDQ
ncbi:hypothetical protein [Nonomuraea sp. NPDC003214]